MPSRSTAEMLRELIQMAADPELNADGDYVSRDVANANGRLIVSLANCAELIAAVLEPDMGRGHPLCRDCHALLSAGPSPAGHGIGCTIGALDAALRQQLGGSDE